MTTIYLIFVAVAIVAIYESVQFIHKRREEKSYLAYVMEMDNSASEQRVVESYEYSERVHDIISSCERNLKRQRAAGFGQWIASLIEGPMYIYYDEKGGTHIKTLTRPINPGIALTAVRMTINELMGSRFNLDTLLWAEAELEKMGEGE